MIQKLDIKLILLESLALIFIITGIKRLHIAYHGEKYDELIKKDWEKYGSLNAEIVGDYFANGVYWIIGIVLIGILANGLLNWRNKIGIINSIVVLIIILGISSTGFFMSGMVNNYLNNFCELFGESYKVSFLTGGLILTFIGITILWKTIANIKKHYTQQRV